MQNDAELQRDVEDEIRWELGAGLSQIGATVKAGAVALTGHVDTFWEKHAAERAAWRVAHVNHVTNGIRVVVPFEKQRGDDDIALAAMGILEWNCIVPKTVEVQVADGLVTLSGAVERQPQKEEAERALETLIGIAGIRNEILIRPSVSLAEVKTHIEAALKRRAFVDRSHIKVHVAHGVVSLRGTVRSRGEYEELLRAVWAAPGVTAIEDHIAIGTVTGE